MNTLRSIVFIIWMYGWMAVLGIAALPTMLLPRRASMKVLSLFSHLVLFGLRWICGIRVELRGREHIPDGPFIVAGKHQAMLDVFIPFILFRDPMVVMKRELLWYPVLGWYATRTGMLPIDRSGAARTVKKMLTVAKARVPQGDGRQLVIFPEGTRTAPGTEAAYHPAGLRAFYKALHLPVLPVATNSGQCWPAHGLTRTPGTIVYEILPPLPADLKPALMMKQAESVLEQASTALLSENQR